MRCPICASDQSEKLYELFDDRYGYPGHFPLWKCQSCNHRFLEQSFTGEELNALYTNYYPRSSIDPSSYKPLRLSQGLNAWFNGEARAFALVPPKSKVLDIGCGACETLGYHKEQGSIPIGVDADANIKKIADANGLEVKIGVFNSKMFENETFDWVTMDQVIEHLTNPIETLREVHKILKPGGCFGFTTPNASGLNAKLFGKKWINWHAPYHTQFFSPNSLKILASKTGFKLQMLKTHTSSEWLLYQEYHVVTFPTPGTPSCFWAADRVVDHSPRETPAFQRATDLHKKKLNHFITRIEDALGVGDNYLGYFEKV